MSHNIVIKQKNVQETKRSANRSDNVYAIIDKAYYVDAIRYKAE
jgi:hypothetical protein